MNKWQSFAQPVATLVLAGAVVFLGFQQGQKASATRVIFPSDMSVSITDMPNIRGGVNVYGGLNVRNPSQRSFRVSGCSRY